MASTFFLAIGFGVGGSLVERDKEDIAKGILAKAGAKLILPRGAVVAPSLERAAERREVQSDRVPAGFASSTSTRPPGSTSAPASSGPARSSGTGPWACSRRRRSTPARGASRTPWSRRGKRGPSPAGGGGRRLPGAAAWRGGAHPRSPPRRGRPRGL